MNFVTHVPLTTAYILSVEDDKIRQEVMGKFHMTHRQLVEEAIRRFLENYKSYETRRTEGAELGNDKLQADPSTAANP